MNRPTYLILTITLTIWLLGCYHAQAQQTTADSALVRERMAMADGKAKADSLYRLATRFRTQIDIEPLLIEALRIAKKTNYKEIEAKIVDYYGVYMRDHSRYSEAIALHTQALDFAREQDDILAQIIALNNLGVVYRRLDESVEALKYHYEALNLAEEINNLYNISIALNSIGNVYILQQNYREAISYFKKCLPIAEQANNYLGMAMNLNNIGEAYEYMNILDSARYYYEKSLVQNQAINAKKGEAICYNSLGTVAMKEEKHDDAIQLFMKSLDINLSLNDIVFVAENYLNLGRAWLKKRQFNQAEEYLQQGLQMALEIGSKYVARDAYKGLMELHEQTKEFAKAFVKKKKYKLYADSIVNEANSKTVMQMEAIYETQKKEIKIAALENENRLYIAWGATGGALCFLLLLFFVVRHRLAVNRTKVAQQQKELAEQRVVQFEQEKQLIATQAVLTGEVQERSRLARDLHDGLGGMLSGLKLNLELLKDKTPPVSDEVNHYDKAMQILNDSMVEMRRVAHHLMPDALNRYGLKAALTDFLNDIPSVEFAWFGSDDRLDDPKREVMIYRIIHELVNNALKHSGATKIGVNVMREPEYIAFTVFDNGCGFDPATESKGKAMGLSNIRERVASCDGRIEVHSTPGEGTEINVELKT
jgi:signal transduction histidine kinase